MELECYTTQEGPPPEIVPGRPQRAWMDAFTDRHAYRCLPLTMANSLFLELNKRGKAVTMIKKLRKISG